MEDPFNLEARYAEADALIQKFFDQAEKGYVQDRHPTHAPKERFLDELLRAGENNGNLVYFMAVGRGYKMPQILDYISLLDFYRGLFEVEETPQMLIDEMEAYNG